MNRSIEAWRLASALTVSLALSACAGLGRKDATEASTEAPTEVEAEVVKTPEERYAEALALLQTNQFSEAQAAFEALTVEVPDQSGPWTNLGLIHQRAKRAAEARQAFANAVRINPDNATAQNQLGILLREAGDPAGARRAYEAALDARPDFAEAHLNLGLLLDNHIPGARAQALGHYREYQALTGGDDLRVLVWIADIEKAMAETAPVDTTAPAEATP